ncbi:MAG: hypothetical protein KDB00_06005 [Planctomycetales bacterium]|nr:hypothetical protein [Planctomycetales bacterium]
MVAAQNIIAGGASFKLTLKDDLTRDIRAAIQGAVEAVRAAQVQIDNQIKSIGQSISRTGKQIAAVGAGAAAFGGGAAFGLARATIAAGDFAETINMFEAVFKEQSNAVRQWGRDYAKEVGRSEAQLLRFLAESQDTFVPLGFDRQQAAELSKTVSKLAIDLGSFKNIDDSDALRRLLGGLIGNTENLRAFGVVAQEAQIKAKALSLGFDPRKLTAYEKALTILQLTIDGTADAQGDAIRTAGGFANSVKALKGAIANLTNAIGGPLLGIATTIVQAITGVVSSINSVISRFPFLAKAAAAGAAALAVLGIAMTAIGAAVAIMGGSIAATTVIGLSLIVRVHGIAAALTAASAAFRAFSAAVFSSSFALVTGQASMAAFVVGLRHALAAILTLTSTWIATIASIKVTTILAGIATGIKVVVAAIVSGIAIITRAVVAASVQLAGILVNPWIALLVVIAAAVKAVELYWKKKQQFEKDRGTKLEQERVRIVGKSFKDAGQAVPANLSKTIDFNNARVVNNDGDGLGNLSNAQQELADEIEKLRSPLETFRERMKDANALLARGTIDQAQFDKFAKQEAERFKQNDPATRQRESLREQLQTPVEAFRKSIAEARQAFATEPAMFKRAVEAAREQFRASDRATQLAVQLQTPVESLRTAIAEAKRVFADSPKNLSRAIAAAQAQFRAADPLEQLKTALRTPAEIFRARIAELNELLAGVPEALRATLLARGKANALADFKRTDPAQRAAQAIRDSIRTDAADIAKRMREAWELVRRGIITRSDATAFGKKLLDDAIGKRPDVANFANLGTSSALVAANLGAFAPTFSDDKELIEWQRKQAKLQAEIRDELKRNAGRRTVFN